MSKPKKVPDYWLGVLTDWLTFLGLGLVKLPFVASMGSAHATDADTGLLTSKLDD